MDISYGILDYNPDSNGDALKILESCMSALAHSRSARFSSEVFLINQGNANAEYNARLLHLCHLYGFNYLALTANIGISRGINYLAQISRGEIISLVTSDVEVARGTDEILIRELDADPRLYQITPAVNVSSIRYQTAAEVVDRPPLKCIATELTVQFWRRDAFTQIGYFDERWKACYENIDWTMRLFLDGYDSAVSYRSRCFHHHNTTSKTGAINHAYDDYLAMEGGIDHRVLRRLWNEKWPDLDWHFMYNPNRLNQDIRGELRDRYADNVYLRYRQEVPY